MDHIVRVRIRLRDAVIGRMFHFPVKDVAMNILAEIARNHIPSYKLVHFIRQWFSVLFYAIVDTAREASSILMLKNRLELFAA